MPTYDYFCDACKYAFEKFHSMKDDPIKKCPKCSKLKVRRLVGTGGGILFKGTGFYQTDYRSSGYKDKAQKESAPKESSNASSDSKPAKKPDSGEKK